MAQLVEFMLADGSTVLVAGDLNGPAIAAGGDDEPDRVAMRGWRDRATAATEVATVAATETFEQAIEHIRPAAESLVAQLQSMAGGPDELTIEFGLQMSAQAGAYIAQAAALANFKVTVLWRKP